MPGQRLAPSRSRKPAATPTRSWPRGHHSPPQTRSNRLGNRASVDLGSGLVFTWGDGRPLHPERFSRWFERLAREAGLPKIRLHDVRHSYATAPLAAGVPAKV